MEQTQSYADQGNQARAREVLPERFLEQVSDGSDAQDQLIDPKICRVGIVGIVMWTFNPQRTWGCLQNPTVVFFKGMTTGVSLQQAPRVSGLDGQRPSARCVPSAHGKLRKLFCCFVSTRFGTSKDLLKWFKNDFFRWTDSPFCQTCSTKATKNEGFVEPTEKELRYGGKSA